MARWEHEDIFAKFNSNPPADELSIRRFESESAFRLPQDYAGFLKRSNGGEGFIGNAYIILWRIEELLDLNNSYQVAEYAPGLFIIGSDGGGEAFAFDTRTDSRPIVSVPFVGMELELARHLASSFTEFLESLLNS